MDEVERRIVDALQGGFPVSEQPFTEAAKAIGLDEEELLARLAGLLERGVLSRFGPLWNVERLGGAVTLAAMQVPRERLDEVAALVNAHPEVAHNYERDHAFNMWFVVAAEKPERIQEVIAAIGRETGLAVLDLPKRREFFLELKLAA
jgi:DNA-binding Lrp family transcriptional regulator